MGKSKKKKKKSDMNNTPQELNLEVTNLNGDLSQNGCTDVNDTTKYTNTSTVQAKLFSVDDLMSRVNDYIEKFEFDLAIKFCQKAISLEPNNTQVLESLGNIYTELGDVENAKMYFLQSVDGAPERGHVKYLYLGQLSEGWEAVKYYQKAIALLQNNVTESNAKQASDGTNEDHDISVAYTSLAELFMTDLCMDDSAEEECRKYCQLAIDTDGENIDAYITMAGFLITVNNMEQASAICKQAFQLWQHFSELAQDNIPDVVSYQSRSTLVKNLIEVEDYDSVPPIIEQLIEENEDDVLLWYYMGLAKSLQIAGAPQDPSHDSPKYFLEKALHLFTKVGCDDSDIYDHINELLKSCIDLGQVGGLDLDTIDEDQQENIVEEKESVEDSNCCDMETD